MDISRQDRHVLFRSKRIYDGAQPASNAIALSSQLELFGITEQDRWKKSADKLLGAFAGSINANPVAAAMFLSIFPK